MTREKAKNYIGELKMYAKSQGWDEEYQIACDIAMNELEQEPSKGHWMLRNSFLVPYKCSECNYKSERYDNYCPNCGAKMVELWESEDKE